VFFFLAVIAVPIYEQAPLSDYWAIAIFGALPLAIVWFVAQQRH